jgi:nucleoside-diphosphate-sugar epimerase
MTQSTLPRRKRVLVTGGAGFVGRAVVSRLLAEGVEVRVLIHRTELPPALRQRVQIVRADLGAPETLRAIADEVDVIIHAAVHIGDDAASCDRINGQGTEALVREARAAKVTRFLALSNCAVYGWAVHRGSTETAVTVDPSTPISRSRVRAERAVLEAGGTVLRPLFVYGDGDTRFIPTIIRAAHRLPFVVRAGRARLSVISVDELAACLVAGALADPALDLQGVFHVNDAHPITFAQLLQTLERVLGLRAPRWSIPYGLARVLLRLAPGRTGATAWSASAEHRIFLISFDHWYDATRLRSRLGLADAGDIATRLPAARDWYLRFT